MTALEALQQMAVAENIRAQRNWKGLENDKLVTPKEIKRLAQAQATLEEPPEYAPSSKALRQRALSS